jgi:hypothetical protein
MWKNFIIQAKLSVKQHLIKRTVQVSDSIKGRGTAWTKIEDKKDGKAVTSKFLSSDPPVGVKNAR